MITQKECNEIADFVIENSDGFYSIDDHAHIASYAYVHSIYHTLMIVRDKGKIVAICRWNWITNSEAKILDLIIRPDYRNRKVARDMLLKAKLAMPQLERISFQRKKYSNRASEVLVSRWLKEIYGKQTVTHNH